MALAQTYGKELWTGVFYRDQIAADLDALVGAPAETLRGRACRASASSHLFVKH